MSREVEPHPRRWLILCAVLMGTLVGTFGGSMVNVALPAIMDGFGVPISSAVWVLTIYILLVAVLMPIFGRLGDMYGYKRIYLVGLSLLAGASLLAVVIRWFPGLVAARALQGIGNATTLPSVMAIITHVFPSHERGRAMGLWAAVNGVGHGLGPVIGGYLTESLGWSAVFAFNATLTILGIVLIWWLVPDDTRRVTRRFDAVGAATMTLAMIALMLNLTQGARLGWFTLLSLALWAAFAGLMAAFLVAERRIKPPFVELSLFANRRYTATVGIIGAQFFCLFGMQLLLPFFLMQVQGRPTGQAGVLIAALSITSAVMAPLAGRLADSFGCRRMCVTGMTLVATSGALMMLWQPSTSSWQIVGTLILLGLGMGFTQSPVAAAVTFTVVSDQLGVALGIFNMVRFIGASLGSTVFGVILEGATAEPTMRAYRVSFALLIAVAVAAVLLALGVPTSRKDVPQLAAQA
ncbi:MAG TPA: MFS transporter [Anaerolineae bacterium]|nr:MFS transporter [Anaerolineae bacterium]